MRKFLPGLVLLNLLIAFLIPIMVSAQTGSPECCKLRKDITWEVGKVTSGTVKGGSPVDAVYCPNTTAGYCDCENRTDFPKGCILEKNNTVGDQTTAKCSIENSVGVPNQPPDYKIQGWGMVCLFHTLYRITDWIFVILVILVALFVIIGAFMFVTSAGDPEKTKSGRLYIMWAAIGLLIAFLAKAVPGVVKLVSGF